MIWAAAEPVEPEVVVVEGDFCWDTCWGDICCDGGCIVWLNKLGGFVVVDPDLTFYYFKINLIELT